MSPLGVVATVGAGVVVYLWGLGATLRVLLPYRGQDDKCEVCGKPGLDLCSTHYEWGGVRFLVAVLWPVSLAVIGVQLTLRPFYLVGRAIVRAGERRAIR
jgi:hypothetical protein